MPRLDLLKSKILAGALSLMLSAIFLATAIAPAIPSASGGTIA